MKSKICVILLVILLSLIISVAGFCQDDPHRYNKNKEWRPYPKEKVNPYQEKEQKRKRRRKQTEAPRKREEKKKEKIDVGDKTSKMKVTKRHFNIGIKGGMTFSYISSKDFAFNNQMDGSVYLANDIRLFDSFFVEIDFGYHASTFNSGDSFYKIEYFSIPIIFKYYFSKSFIDPNVLELWGGVGLEFRFKVGDEGFGWANELSDNNQGIVFALGARSRIVKDLYITIDCRFYLGLSSAFKSVWNEKNYLREFELMFGVSYDIF